MRIGSKFHLNKSKRDERQSNVYLRSPSIGLGAKMDLVKLSDNSAIIWEVKRYKSDTPPLGHLLQLTTAGMIVEEVLGAEEIELRILYHGGSEFRVENYQELRVLAEAVISEMRHLIEEQIIPPPTKNKEKCKSCEFWKICLGT